ncbi:Nucleotidyltransferase [Serendipita vermifera]|nr:Nucleotidyltransferase [Serendipita vermifera]
MPVIKPISRRLSPSSNTSSSSREGSPSKLPAGIFSGMKIKIIDAKLTPKVVAELSDMAEENGARLIANADEADVVVTEIGSRARLERHITWEAAQARAVVEPRWLRRSVKEHKLLGYEKYLAIDSLKPPSMLFKSEPDVKVALVPSGSKSSPIELSDTSDIEEFNAIGLTSNYSVHRRTPLICPNQEFISQLAVIKRARWLDRDERSELSYARAIASIKAYPRKITSVPEIEQLPWIGPKITDKMRQYLKTGMIEETQKLQNDPMYDILAEFTKIYGIGPSKARQLYDLGMRSFDDLKGHFSRELESGKSKDAVYTQSLLHSLALHHEFEVKISRAEVEQIARVVTEELENIHPGFVHTITGGYRRGKPESNDIDIVFSHPDNKKGKGSMDTLLSRLQRRGIITHLLPPSSFRTPGGMKSYSQDQALQRVLSVFVLPTDAPSFPNNPAGQSRVHRRVDLIYAPMETYWCAVVGWTGSITFERDLRRWCKDKLEYKFDSSGLTRRRDMARITVYSERHLFDTLGLPYIEPRYRNCDY